MRCGFFLSTNCDVMLNAMPCICVLHCIRRIIMLMIMTIVILLMIKIPIIVKIMIIINYILKNESTIIDMVRNMCTNGLMKRLQIVC